MLRILVVGDEPDTTDTIHFMLEAWGFVVLTASAGPSAVTAASAFHPDTVLLDMGLPWKEAFAATREIRQLGGKQPIIICMSGYKKDEYRRQALEAGCDHFFLKPVDLDELKAFLRTLETLNRELTGRDLAADNLVLSKGDTWKFDKTEFTREK
jgi:DNA-binding response OmpR family regulator